MGHIALFLWTLNGDSMDSEECTNYSNPFTVNDLWESSKFTLQPLRPLDPSLDTELPSKWMLLSDLQLTFLITKEL